MYMEYMYKGCLPFGMLVFLIGLVFLLKDLGYLSLKITMWPLLIIVFGLCIMGCGTYCKPKK